MGPEGFASVSLHVKMVQHISCTTYAPDGAEMQTTFEISIALQHLMSISQASQPECQHADHAAMLTLEVFMKILSDQELVAKYNCFKTCLAGGGIWGTSPLVL